MAIIRSSCLHMFFKKSVLEHFANFTGKHLCSSLFLIKLQVFRPATLINWGSSKSVFLWNLRNINTSFYRTLPVAGSGSRVFGRWVKKCLPPLTTPVHCSQFQVSILSGIWSFSPVFWSTKIVSDYTSNQRTFH